METSITQPPFSLGCQVATETFTTGWVSKTTKKGVNVKTELQILTLNLATSPVADPDVN